MDLRGILETRIATLRTELEPEIGRDPTAITRAMLGEWDAVASVAGKGPAGGIPAGYGTNLVDMRDEYDALWIAVWDGAKNIDLCGRRITQLESALVVSGVLCADVSNISWKKPGLEIVDALSGEADRHRNFAGTAAGKQVLKVSWYSKHARPGQHTYLAPLRALDQRVCEVCRNICYPWREANSHGTEQFVAVALRRAVQLLILGYRSRLAISERVGVSLDLLNKAYERNVVRRAEDCMFPVCSSEGLCSTNSGLGFLSKVRYWDSAGDCWLQHYPPRWFSAVFQPPVSGRARAALSAWKNYAGGKDAFLDILETLYAVYDVWWKSRSKNSGGAPRRRKGWPRYGIKRVLAETKMTSSQLAAAIELAKSF